MDRCIETKSLCVDRSSAVLCIYCRQPNLMECNISCKLEQSGFDLDGDCSQQAQCSSALAEASPTTFICLFTYLCLYIGVYSFYSEGIFCNTLGRNYEKDFQLI